MSVEVQRNFARDYWRTVVVSDVARDLGHSVATLESVVMRNGLLADSMLRLLDDLTAQEARDGRTHGMQVGCTRQCTDIARAHRHLATAHAPKWVTE